MNTDLNFTRRKIVSALMYAAVLRPDRRRERRRPQALHPPIGPFRGERFNPVPPCHFCNAKVCLRWATISALSGFSSSALHDA